jgi:hypothetical protein
VLTHHPAVRVPGHTARDIDKKHGFEVVGAVDDAFCELVEGRAACIVDYVGNLGGVFVRLDLAVTFVQEVVSDNGWESFVNSRQSEITALSVEWMCNLLRNTSPGLWY